MPSSWLPLMIGPITVSSSLGSPALSPRARSTKRSANSSCTEESTTIRLVIMQTWPWWKNFPKIAASTA